MGNQQGYWVYVVDEDRGRFAILTHPRVDPQLWAAQVHLACRDGGRRLHAGRLSVDLAATYVEAAALIRAEVGNLAQFEPRAILAASHLLGLHR